jgi:hypothetical protein
MDQLNIQRMENPRRKIMEEVISKIFPKSINVIAYYITSIG